jgi:hypothetical protein
MQNPSPFVLQHVMPILGQSTILMWELVDKLCSFLWEVNNQARKVASRLWLTILQI